MRALIQRAARAAITIDGEKGGSIGRGLVVLLGVTHDDDMRDVNFLADKCINLRIFEDAAGKMNLSLSDVGGGLMVVSQFTLYGDASHGRRPGFTEAAAPETAIPLYEAFVARCRESVADTVTGKFGSDMQVELVNDGPVTLMVESRK
ncbi:MAG: D-aminoacyl-tRNA deacylase [Victivallaceae bacterium]|nr:D-aminoacyl-tRNA deacylase [Victivallaceae bacterium]